MPALNKPVWACLTTRGTHTRIVWHTQCIARMRSVCVCVCVSHTYTNELDLESNHIELLGLDAAFAAEPVPDPGPLAEAAVSLL